MVNEAANKDSIQINPVLKNSGSLPARNLLSKGNAQFCLKGGRPPGFFPKTTIDDAVNKSDLAGLQETRFLIRHQIKPSIQESIRRGDVIAYLYGTLTYDDSFVPGTAHSLHYCFGLVGMPSLDELKEGRVQMSDVFLCGDKSNCTDDDCGDIHEEGPTCESAP